MFILFLWVYLSSQVKGWMSRYFSICFFLFSSFFFFLNIYIKLSLIAAFHYTHKSNKHEPGRYKQWCWCWKSICIALTKYKGQQFSSLLLRKITFPKSSVPFSRLLLSLTRTGRLSQLASVCRLIQMDMASRPSVPHRPSGWTWLPGLQMGRRAPHLWWTLDPLPNTTQSPHSPSKKEKEKKTVEGWQDYLSSIHH